MTLRGWITLHYSMGTKPNYEYPCNWGKRQKALTERRQCGHISKGWSDGTTSQKHLQTPQAARTSAQWHLFLTSGSQNIGLQKPRTESFHVHLSKPAVIMLSIPACLTQDKPQIRQKRPLSLALWRFSSGQKEETNVQVTGLEGAVFKNVTQDRVYCK